MGLFFYWGPALSGPGSEGAKGSQGSEGEG